MSAAACPHCGLPVRSTSEGAAAFCCLGCRLAYELARPVEGEGPGGTLLLRLGAGIFLAMNISVFSWFAYSQEIFGEAARAGEAYGPLAGLFAWLALFLTTLVLVLLGMPLLEDALASLTHGRADARILIVLGVFSAWALSAYNTVRGSGSLYFDTAALVLVIVTLGAYLEAGAKARAAGAGSQLLADLPARVRVDRGAGPEEVAAEAIERGDLLEVRPGETVPADGQVEEGAGHVDESSLTGEAWPRPVAPGAQLLAGSLNLEGRLWMRVAEAGRATVLAQMEHYLLLARELKPPVQRLADRVATLFVPGVMALALGVLVVRVLAGVPEDGLLRALAVLLISCPCALGLAAPLASWCALRLLAERGVLVESAAVLERAASLDRLFLDKTGTLTEPVPALESLSPGGRKALALAAGLGTADGHPMARALVVAAREHGVVPAVAESVHTVPGLGIEGTVGGRRLRLGGARWARQLGVEVAEPPAGSALLFLLEDGQVVGRFPLRERLRPGTEKAVRELAQLGVTLEILSGDRPAAVERISEGLDLPGSGGLLPVQKVERLEAARARGEVVAMVGDGLNDGPVLAAADLGVAVGSASELARRSGNVRLLGDSIERLASLVSVARRTRRVIRANLLFAFAFNGIGLYLAATGRLTPVFAALAMALSSLLVVRISTTAAEGPGTEGASTVPSQPIDLLEATP